MRTAEIGVKRDPDEYSIVQWEHICQQVDGYKEGGTVSAEELMDVQLGDGEVVAVIGARESNVGRELWENPRCVFLQGAMATARGLPANTRAVVFTRFLGHTDFSSIMNQVRRRKLAVYPIQGTGQLKRTLTTLLAPPPAAPVPEPEGRHGALVVPEFSPAETREPETPEPETLRVSEPHVVGADPPTPENDPAGRFTPPEAPDDMAKTFQRGDVTAWVREHFTPGMKFVDIIKLADRAKVPFKESSISAAFYAVKREAGVSAKKKAPKPPPVTADKIQQEIERVAAVPPPAPVPNGDNLVKLVDEVMAGLQLVREAAVRMAADREKMAQILALAQQLGVK